MTEAQLCPSETWLTVAELKALGISKPTVCRWRARSLGNWRLGDRGWEAEISSLPQRVIVAFERGQTTPVKTRLEVVPRGVSSGEFYTEAGRLRKLVERWEQLDQATGPRRPRRQRDGVEGHAILEEYAHCPAWVAERSPSRTRLLRPRSMDRLVDTFRRFEAEGANGSIILMGRMLADPKSKKVEELPDAARAYILRLWLREHAANRTQVWRLYDAVAKRRGWGLVSRRSLSDFLNSQDKQVEMFARHGEREFESRFGPYVIRDRSEYAAGELLIGDHHKFDVFVRDGGRLEHPWVTLWLDIRSNSVWGYSINLGPSGSTIRHALVHAILPKHGCPEHELAAYARMCGTPDRAHVDNGRDYRGHAIKGSQADAARLSGDEVNLIEGLMPELHIGYSFALVRNAKGKPVERFFGVVASDFSTRFFNSGFCGRSPAFKPHVLQDLKRQHEAFLEGRAASSPFMTLQEFGARFQAWLLEYHSRPQDDLGARGQKLSPLQAVELFGRAPRIPTPDAVRYLLMDPTPATIGRNGVKIDHVYYRSYELLRHVGRRVEVLRDPGNASLAHIFLDGRKLCEASAVEAVGKSVDQLRSAMKEKREHRKRVEQAYATLIAGAPVDIPPIERSLDPVIPSICPEAPRPAEAVTHLLPKFDAAARARPAPPPDPIPITKPRAKPKAIYCELIDEWLDLHRSAVIPWVPYELWKVERERMQAEFDRLIENGELATDTAYLPWSWRRWAEFKFELPSAPNQGARERCSITVEDVEEAARSLGLEGQR